MAQLVKNPPAMWETWVRSLGWEDPLEKGKAAHSSVPAWRSPWAEQSWSRKELGTTERWTRLSALHFTFTFTFPPILIRPRALSLAVVIAAETNLNPRVLTYKGRRVKKSGLFSLASSRNPLQEDRSAAAQGVLAHTHEMPTRALRVWF